MTDEKALEEARERWERETLRKYLEEVGERKEAFTTDSGRPVATTYTPLDDPKGPYEEALGFPGGYPFTRGIHPTMYRGRLWTTRQYAGFGTAEASNERYKYLLSQGNTGLSVAFDLPTQMGYDSDNPRARGEVGRVGVAVTSLQDMEVLLRDIPLGKVSTSMTINATAMILLALYVAVAEGHGVPRAELRGTVQNDILKEYAARGTYIFPPKPSMRLATDIIIHCAAKMRRWNPISISGYHMREAGCTAAQEVAFTLAHATAYVDHVLQRGLPADRFAPQLSFFFAAQMDLMEEVAKFRAARRTWARIMKEEYGAKDPRSWTMRFHTQTAGAALTAQQPENNVVRVAIQALAAVLGGTQSLHTNSMDEALALPSERAARLALRTQQILGHETGVVNTVDPFGGAHHLEALTDQIEEEVWGYLHRIRALGGVLVALERGFVQREISEAAYRYQREVEEGKRIVVGVNAFQQPGAPAPEIQRLDPQLEGHQIERLKRFRAARSQDEARRSLEMLRAAAQGEENLFSHVLEAVKAGATLGEVSEALASVFGRFRGVREV